MTGVQTCALPICFGKQLRSINLDIVNDLLSHPLVEVQTLGGNILLNHETSVENLPNELINSLIDSLFEEIRTIGIRLFGQLADENLVQRQSIIMSLLTHQLADVHNATRPIVSRLSAKYPNFTENLANAIFIELLQTEKHEGVHARLLEVLRDLPNWTNYADLEIATLLVKSNSTASNEIGGLLLQNHALNFCGATIRGVGEFSGQRAGRAVELHGEPVGVAVEHAHAVFGVDVRGLWHGGGEAGGA